MISDKDIVPMEGELMEEAAENAAVLHTASDMKLSPQEEFVYGVLQDYKTKDGRKVDPESLIKEIIEDSDKVVMQNAKGDIIPDYKSRAQLKMELLKAAGVVKKNTPEVRINFLNLLFGNKNGL